MACPARRIEGSGYRKSEDPDLEIRGNGNGNGNGNGGGTVATPRMYLEYLGSANAAGSPCASGGLPGGGTSSGPLVAALVR